MDSVQRGRARGVLVIAMTDGAWDYLWIEPKVLLYLVDRGRPRIISITEIEEWIEKEHGWPPRVQPLRVRHCISRALGQQGYKRRSKKGYTWDRVRGGP